MSQTDRQKEIDFVDLYQRVLKDRVSLGDFWYYAGHSFQNWVLDYHDFNLKRELEHQAGIYLAYSATRNAIMDEAEMYLYNRTSMYNRARKCEKILKVLCSKR